MHEGRRKIQRKQAIAPQEMPTPTVVLVPMWAPGHFASMLEAAKTLQLRAGGGGAIRLTALVLPPPPDSEASEVTTQLRRLETASDDAVGFRHLPAVEHFHGLVHPSEYIRLFASHVKEAIAALAAAAPVAAVIVDMFAAPLLDVVNDFAAVPAYVYFTSTGALLALMLRLPAIHDEVAARFREKEGTVDVPGMPPVPVASLPSPRVNDYDWFAYLGRRYAEARGIIVNTAAELEPGVLAAIADGRCTPAGVRAPAVYPIGPVLSLKDDDHQSPPHECVRWLDARPPASVVFLCFGSMGCMDAAQAREVAAGLERSERSFLWVLRAPPAAGDSRRYPTDADLDVMLPDGFLERTKGMGLVWPRWAPQSEILAHAAVGGFVTHGGWNSVLESLWFGVPMAPWPLYAEQHLNAFELVAGMGVAVELRMCAGRERDGFVEAAELERAVRSLMGGDEEGRRARGKAKGMQAACRKAVEKGGSSYVAMEKVVQDMLGSCTPKEHV
ncbi:hypothetical protein ACP4OV_029546 [Aristida adscensionis]